MTAAGPIAPPQQSGSHVAHGERAARGAMLREGCDHDRGAYALPWLGRAFALRALAGITGEGADARTGWIHVAVPGTWEGHPSGPFTLGDEEFDSAIRAFAEQANPIPVDWEHATVRPDAMKAPAAGWVQRLERRGDGLWALVEWTEAGAHDIRSGAYRYCSGVFEFGKPDRRTGEPILCCLTSIGLTNTPFIDGQRPIVLSQRRVALSGGKQMEIPRDALLEALNKLEGDAFTPDQIEAIVESLEAMQRAQSGEPAVDIDVDVDEPQETALADEPDLETKPDGAVSAQDDAAQDPAAALAEFEALAAAMGKDLAGLLAYLRELVSAQEGGAAVENPAALKAEVAALKATVQSYGAQLRAYREREAKERRERAERRRRALRAEVAKMVSDGVITKADEQVWLKLAETNEVSFRALKSTLKPAVPTGREASAMPAPHGRASTVDGSVLDKSDPKIRALFDRYEKAWGISDPTKVERLVRRHLATTSAG